MPIVRPPAPPQKVHELPRRRPSRLVLDLDPALAARLDEAIGIVAQSRAALELGIRVDRSRVARVALVRGLDELAREGFAPQTAEPEVRNARAREAPAPRARQAAPDAAPPVLRADGTMEPPATWKNVETERPLAYQAEVHGYYAERGWGRYLMFLSDDPTEKASWVYVFWADRLEDQEGVLLFPGAQVVQLGERGLAHTVPGNFGKDA